MSAVVAKQPPSPFSPELERQLVDWLSHPDPHIELLGGRLVSKFPSGADPGKPTLTKGKHGAAQLAIGTQIMRLQGPDPAVGPGGPGGDTRWWITQEVDLFVGGEGMRPDLAGWRLDRHPAPPAEVNVPAKEGHEAHLGVVIVAPDWVCEVLSSSTAPRDRGPRGVKWKAYQRAGVEWYWLLDLANESLTVYQRTARSYEVIEVAGAGDVMRLPPFGEVEFALQPLFVYARAQL